MFLCPPLLQHHLSQCDCNQANAKFPFGSVLIANRGEVACRIAKACKELQLSTVAIYTSEDNNSPILNLCDQNYLLEGETLQDTYLNINAIINAAKQTGAQAIHPGFGFLSESAKFAKAVDDAGIVWIGPSPDAIEVMGDKMAARMLAEKVGVPVVPGTTHPIKDLKASKAILEPKLITTFAIRIKEGE